MGAKIHELRRKFLLRVFTIIDLVLLTVSFVLAMALTTGSDLATALASAWALKVSVFNCLLFAIGLGLGHGVLVMCNLYESKRLSNRNAEAWDVLRAMAIVTACIWCEAKLFRVPGISNYLFPLFWAIGTLLMLANRMLIRALQGVIRKRGRNLHHVLILGTNPRAVEFARLIEELPERGCNLLGFVDDDWKGMDEFKKTGLPLVCDYEGLPAFLRNNVVDEIAMYLPLRSFYERSAEFALLARQHGILLRLDTDLFNFKFERRHAEYADGVPQIVASSNGIDGWQLLIKRILDFAASLALLIFLSPLFLLVAVLIKLTSPGPVVFAQRRIGLNKRQFVMYKFRTMVPDADQIQAQFAHLNEMSGPVFKIKNDPRITPIGRILRKTSIDELPQLLNVLKGDMSLVGPRALPTRDYEFFDEDWQRRRFSVPPGITCLWQVNGRNSISFEQWMLLDMQYIDRWSLWLDLKILALTIPAVFKGTGAV